MKFDFETMLGLIAACLTTGALIPQAIKTWSTRKTGDLSLSMFLMMFFGTGCWLLYGVLRNDPPIIIANAFAITLHFFILFFKVDEIRQSRSTGRL